MSVGSLVGCASQQKKDTPVVKDVHISGNDEISVYAEANDDEVSVFVRDRGAGFDPAAVPGDRRGIAESIEGRMHRAGGTATVSSAPGSGTEVELRLPR